MALAQIDKNNRVYSLDDRYWSYFFYNASRHHSGSRAISWKRGDSLLFLNSVPGIQDPRYSVEMTAEGSTLTITLVKAEDAGQLTCQVASKPPIEKTFNIEIKGESCITQVKQAGPNLCQPPICRTVSNC